MRGTSGNRGSPGIVAAPCHVATRTESPAVPTSRCTSAPRFDLASPLVRRRKYRDGPGTYVRGADREPAQAPASQLEIMSLLRTRRSPHRTQLGQGLVEFALILPIMISMLGISIDIA